MLLPYRKNKYWGSESDLVEEFINFVKNPTSGPKFDREIEPEIYREVSIPKIRRRSDVVLKFTDQIIYNLEFKLEQGGKVVEQAIDHLKWADYSYIVIPINTYLWESELKKIVRHKIGVIYYINGEFIELIKGYKSKAKVASIRQVVKEKLLKASQV